uniref:Uncharacterized protein n=1 Tax=viral metagenome TaxID=1070528 RepID=A0A6M3JT50_9ZZZZ
MGPGLRQLRIEKREDWTKIVEAVREQRNDNRISPLGALKDYSVCRRSVITPFTLELWSLYNDCGGTARVKTPAERYDLPALYVDAVRVIESELIEIKQSRSK